MRPVAARSAALTDVQGLSVPECPQGHPGPAVPPPRRALRTRIEAAVGSVLRPSLECTPLPDEIAVVDAVMEALADVADIPGRLDAQVHLSRPLPQPQELRSLRVDSGLTQQQVADIVGVDPAAVSFWERGIRSPQSGTVERARYLNLIDHLRERREAAA